MPLAAPMATNSIAGASGKWLIDKSDGGEQVGMTQRYVESTSHPIEAKTVPGAMKASQRRISFF